MSHPALRLPAQKPRNHLAVLATKRRAGPHQRVKRERDRERRELSTQLREIA